jgi:methionyl-tRNA formyltransferase
VRAVVFAYHEFGSVCIEELLSGGIQVDALFTHRDDPHEEIWFRTPRAIAEQAGIPVFDPDSLRGNEWVEKIAAYDPDYIFSFYYRNMLPKEILSIPRIAAMNLHGSLLPKFRGRCPVNWVIIKGEKETGVTLHIMVEKPDAGDIVAQKSVAIVFEDTAGSLAMKLVEAARTLMKETIPLLESGDFPRHPQTGVSTYFGGRKPDDGLIDWSKPADEIYNLTRAVTHPYPGAFTFFEGKKLFIWKARPDGDPGDCRPGTVISASPLKVATGAGLLEVLSAQMDGEKELDGHALTATYTFANKTLGGSF